MNKSESQAEIFIKLAKPDENGVSHWVYRDEMIAAGLKLGNGGGFCRKHSSLAKKYKVIIDKTITNGNSIDRIKLDGFNLEQTFNQHIRKDIRDHYKNRPCVMLGVVGNSENTKIEIDHKEGTKNSERISDSKRQTLDDFQSLSKAANDAKRQICKTCQETGIRFDARILEGFSEPYYEGGKELRIYGCKGCYQYDPVAYRKKFFSSK
ncbi:restriction endonuclease [Glaesserella parasuis]|uniref:restriction endonuclease n=1 Tax=Glaesserella parasuis TaxID=738 RepID=UPI0021BF22B6|nr:restriction endonuclease [Glaesserella parasuis]MDO9749704.1 restriction endonuclease [Glaesserella parasuis]MDO9780292.1 restriction endonuclease [Glaesserella parasuis]